MKNHHTSQRQYDDDDERLKWMILSRTPHISQRELWISASYKTMMKWLLSMSTDYDHICPHILLTWFWLYRFHIILLTVFYKAGKAILHTYVYLRTKGKQTNEMCMVRMVFYHKSLERFWIESKAEFKPEKKLKETMHRFNFVLFRV